MVHARIVSGALAALALLLLIAPSMSAQGDAQAKKPSLSLRATPPLGFSPLRVRTSVEVRGGTDDYADFYCPTIEWDWGDGTISENSEDCDPYEAGKSTIRRRFSGEHTYYQAGSFKLTFRLKQKNRAVGIASVNMQVRPGSQNDF
jgi:hypothetical protein